MTHDELEIANAFFREGDYGRAGQGYKSVLAREPDNAAALHSLGYICNQRGEHTQAIALLRRAIALRPSAPYYHVNLAEAYRNAGDYERALATCETAIILWPNSADGLNTLGLVLNNMGRHAEAAERFRAAIEARPTMSGAHNNLGLALQSLGDLEGAACHFARSLDLNGDFNRARVNLGLALLALNRPVEAIPILEESARRQPDRPVLRINLGNAYKAMGDYDRARESYVEALALDRQRPHPYLLVGQTLRAESRFDEALPWFRGATTVAPDQAHYWEQLAELQGEREEHDNAITCWRKAIELDGVDRAHPHNGLAWSFHEQARPHDSIDHYLVALGIEPANVQSHLGLGSAYEELGRFADAEASLRAAMRHQPTAPIPHGRLATLLRGKLGEDDLVALLNRLEDPRLASAPRARLLFGLAHVLDARGEFARACAALREANALTMAEHKGRLAYRVEDHERYLDRIIEFFDTPVFDGSGPSGSVSCRPIFVFGFPRSGTTLTEQILASHPSVFGAGECRFSRQAFDSIPDLLDLPGDTFDLLPSLDSSHLRAMAEAFLEKLAAIDGGTTPRIVDKMPDNYLYLGLLRLLFPNATFIHCSRNPRDVAVSCWMTDFRSIRWANDHGHLASRIAGYRRLMRHWGDVLPAGTIHQIDYEDTVADLEGVARRLISACGLEWDPACIQFHTNARSVRTASVTQVRQPIYTKSVERWKKYAGHLDELFALIPTEDFVAL